jgi:hypothetical protein
MKTNSTQQEILLITGTSFSSRQCYQKDDEANENNLTEKEQLEEACWNGLLQYLLPEIYLQADDKKIYLWQIKEAASLKLNWVNNLKKKRIIFRSTRILSYQCDPSHSTSSLK